PTAHNKWLVASVVEDAAGVVSRVFDEAERRDPRPPSHLGRTRRRQQPPDRPHPAEARARQVDVTIVVDFVHVLEYRRAVLKGQAAGVAGAIGARPLGNASIGLSGRPSTSAPATWSASCRTSTIPLPWSVDGRLPPVSSNVPAGIWSRTAWTSP